MALLHVPLNKSCTLPSPQGLLKLSTGSSANLAGKVRVPGQGRRLALPLQCSVTRGGKGLAESTVLPKEEIAEEVPTTRILRRSSFPHGFAFGAATSAYQVEGAWNEGGRGPSIWDHFTHLNPDKIKDKSTGDTANEAYHRYREDVQMMKKMGLDSYRFSISWSRILPKGNLEGGVNQEGIKYYSDLIDELMKNGIKPFVTLFHWDVPQALEEAYGGFLDRRIIKDFKDFADICFRNFGDRVQHWITLNEPWTFSTMGYCFGLHAPGRCSRNVAGCPVGDSTTEPYIVTHNLILAHAAAARLYKDQYQAKQGGEVGITLVSLWFEPLSDTPRDKEAACRAVEAMLGWYMDPLAFGDYPHSMRALVRDRLPHFTEEEEAMIKGSYDFIGINYYTSRYIQNVLISPKYMPDRSNDDSYALYETSRQGVPIGELHGGEYIYFYPNGLKDLLYYIKDRYNNPQIYITENGTCEEDKPDVPLDKPCNDQHRIDCLAAHLAQLQQAIRDGVHVKGYFHWSLMDNFEWAEGYTLRFGLVYIDYADNLKRVPKASAEWYTEFLHFWIVSS